MLSIFLDIWRYLSSDIQSLFNSNSFSCRKALFKLLQIVWGGFYQEHAALWTGESMEQFFSYFAKCGLTTKSMNAAGNYIKALFDILFVINHLHRTEERYVHLFVAFTNQCHKYSVLNFIYWIAVRNLFLSLFLLLFGWRELYLNFQRCQICWIPLSVMHAKAH